MSQSASSVTAVIIDADESAQFAIENALANAPYQVQVLAKTDSLVYGYEIIRQNNPSIVFVSLGQEPEKSLEVIQRISTYFKGTFVVASGEQMTIETVIACMQAGAREYLQRPFETEQVAELMDSHWEELYVDPESGDNTGRIVTVFSNKGGLGKTTVAVNLAMALSKTVDDVVVLVDLNLQLGDITTFLDIEPKQTIVDLARNIGRVDAAYLENSLAEYQADGARVLVLADPLNVEEAEDVSAEQINTVLTVLKASFKYIVIDTTTSFDSKTLTALDLADDILLVSIVNLPCIRSSQRLLALFDRLEYDPQKIKLLVNRYVADDEITAEDVEDTLEHPVYWKIPNAYQVVMNSINRGIPIHMVEGSQNLFRNFLDLAHKLTGKIAETNNVKTENSAGSKNKSLLGNLFKK